MPAAPRLVLVTDRHATRDLVTSVRAALDAGLPAVQLREKDLPGRPLLALAEALRAATTASGALLFVNDRVDVAVAAGADGVHLGVGAVPVDVARGLLPPGALVGVSTHAPAEVAAAAAAGADFCFFGPVYPTPSKSGAQGETALREATRAGTLPVLAIGGVEAERVRAARAAGAAGVAVIRAILAAPDPAAATRALLAALD
jgi:thiamine-phosphate pyrophosphorylase